MHARRTADNVGAHAQGRTRAHKGGGGTHGSGWGVGDGERWGALTERGYKPPRQSPHRAHTERGQTHSLRPHRGRPMRGTHAPRQRGETSGLPCGLRHFRRAGRVHVERRAKAGPRRAARGVRAGSDAREAPTPRAAAYTVEAVARSMRASATSKNAFPMPPCSGSICRMGHTNNTYGASPDRR